MRVLGIDPGSRITGFGLVEIDGGHCRHLLSGPIRLPDGPLPARLAALHRRLCQVIDEWQPQVMAVEQVFLANNARSALVLGQARGAAVVTGASRGLEVVEYSALQVKQALVGRGRADKAQVQHMVKVLLGLGGTLQADAADALACAICHVHTDSGIARRTERTRTRAVRA